MFNLPDRRPEDIVYFGGHYDQPDTYMTKRPNGMMNWLITFTLQGEGYYIVDGQRFICRAGDVALLRPHTPHEYGTSPGKRWNFLWAHFDPILETPYLSPLALHIETIQHAHIRERMTLLFQWFIQDAQERLPHWQALCASTLKNMLLLISQRQQNTLDARVEMTLHLLTVRMKEAVKISELADAVGLSASRLSHLFKETTGETIIEALNRIRLNQAAMLLKHTDRNATEAALESGFHHYNHFSAQFRQRYGISPGAFKRQFQLNQSSRRGPSESNHE